jgi:hypothetical protein
MVISSTYCSNELDFLRDNVLLMIESVSKAHQRQKKPQNQMGYHGAHQLKNITNCSMDNWRMRIIQRCADFHLLHFLWCLWWATEADMAGSKI